MNHAKKLLAQNVLKLYFNLRDAWRERAKEFRRYGLTAGFARRMSLRRHAEGLILHDRILTGRLYD